MKRLLIVGLTSCTIDGSGCSVPEKLAHQLFWLHGGRRDHHWRDRNSFDRPRLSCHRFRSAYPAGDRMRCHWRKRNAIQKRAGATLDVGYDLFLVSAGPFCVSRPSLDHALVGELPPVRVGCSRLWVRAVRSVCASTAVARMGQASHFRNELVLRRHVDSLLRGQRKTVADLERPSSLCLLACAASRGGTGDHLGAGAAPNGSSDEVSRTYLRRSYVQPQQHHHQSSRDHRALPRDQPLRSNLVPMPGLLGNFLRFNR